GYPVTLWPVELTSARLQAPPFPLGLQPPPKTAAILRFQLECQAEMKFAELGLDTLRFYLAGDNQVIASLYELIFNHTLPVLFRTGEREAKQTQLAMTPQQCLRQVGFELEDGLLPYPPQSFLGYRLLTEFFTFSNKFLFLDLKGWKQVRQAGFQKKVEII